MKQEFKKRYSVEMDIQAQESGLECPLCECRTLNRDTVPAADGWYVEWCSGGVLVIEEWEPDDGRLVKVEYEFECPYAWAGFKK